MRHNAIWAASSTTQGMINSWKFDAELYKKVKKYVGKNLPNEKSDKISGAASTNMMTVITAEIWFLQMTDSDIDMVVAKNTETANTIEFPKAIKEA